MLFYAVHPLLNEIINSLNREKLLKVCTCLTVLYVVLSLFDPNAFCGNVLMSWGAFYFDIAYVKRYAMHVVRNGKLNRGILLFGVFGLVTMEVVLNLPGSFVPALDNNMQIWNVTCNPFMLMIAASLMNLAFGWNSTSSAVKSLSKCSYLIYVMHENLMMRTYIRPWIWNWIYKILGDEWILLWNLLYIAGLLFASWGLSVLYQATLQKAARWLSERILQKANLLYRKYAGWILAKNGTIKTHTPFFEIKLP